MYRDNIRDSRHTVTSLQYGWDAHVQRMAGIFDKFVDEEFETMWETKIPENLRFRRHPEDGDTSTLKINNSAAGGDDSSEQPAEASKTPLEEKPNQAVVVAQLPPSEESGQKEETLMEEEVTPKEPLQQDVEAYERELPSVLSKAEKPPSVSNMANGASTPLKDATKRKASKSSNLPVTKDGEVGNTPNSVRKKQRTIIDRKALGVSDSEDELA